MGAQRRLSRRAGLPRAAPAPGAPRPAPAPPPPTSSPRPPGLRARRGRRKSLVGWPRQRHARPGPGKQRGDVCGPKSGNGAPVGAGPGAGLLLGAHCSLSAQPHALHKKLTHPAAGHQPLDSGRRGALAGGGLLMGRPGPVLSGAHPRSASLCADAALDIICDSHATGTERFRNVFLFSFRGQWGW